MYAKALYPLILSFIMASCATIQLDTKANSNPTHAQQSYIETSIGMEFMHVPGGCFDMGDIFGDGLDDEKPVHRVCLDGYYIGKYMVTQEQWRTIMGRNPSNFSNCGECPVEQVNWDDVQEYIRMFNQKTGATYRLLTEAEWEYAARSGGKKEKWAGTNTESELGTYAWYEANSGNRTHPVGQKSPNALDLYDMSGNASEWVQDAYSSSTAYFLHAVHNPLYEKKGNLRVIRGGNWGDNPRSLRTTSRYGEESVARTNFGCGFRLARSL